jgi:hypothetical protein
MSMSYREDMYSSYLFRSWVVQFPVTVSHCISLGGKLCSPQVRNAVAHLGSLNIAIVGKVIHRYCAPYPCPRILEVPW